MRSMSAVLAALVLLAALPVLAQPPAGPATPGVESIRLLSGWTRPDGARLAAVQIRLAPGWHTYWRNPGASGVPPEFDWSGSANLADVAYEWPRPLVFDSYGAATIGYKNTLTLPVLLTPAQAGQPIEARLDLFFGVCKDICIPAEARLEARLDPADPAEGRAEIEGALADRPLDAAALGVTARCALAPGDGVGFDHCGRADARPDLWIGPAATRAEGGRLLATARLESAAGAALDRNALRLTLLEDDQALDIRGCAGG